MRSFCSILIFGEYPFFILNAMYELLSHNMQARSCPSEHILGGIRP